MAFLGGLASGLLGMFGQQQANSQTTAAQQQAQQQAQQFQAGQTTQAKQYQQQMLQQALQNLAQYQQQNPSPISQLGGIQGPPQGGAQASFGGGQVGSNPTQPGMPMRQPMQGGAPQNLQGAIQQPQQPPQPQAPPQQNTQRLQQLYPIVQQMLSSQSQRTPQPMARAGGV